MSHEVNEKHIAAYVDGRLPAHERTELEEHFKECSSCSEVLQEYEKLSGFEASVAKEEHRLGPDFSVETMVKLEGYPIHGKWRLHMAVEKTRGFFGFLPEPIPQVLMVVLLVGFFALGSVRFLGQSISEQFYEVSDQLSPSAPAEYRPPNTHQHTALLQSEPEQYYPPAATRVRPVEKYTSVKDRERYGSYMESVRTLAKNNAISTFSIDVDTGSYTNMRRYLSQGTLPPKESVRIEEFINYFDYDYSQEGEDPFSVNYEIAPSPLQPGRHLLKLGIKAHAAEVNSELGWNLVFLVDTSGSMSDHDKLPLIKRGLQLLASRMRPQDHIAIVTYAGSAGLALDSTGGDKQEYIRSAIERMRPGGSTHGSAGIDLAYRVAEGNLVEGGVNRIILATDGDFNVGKYSFQGLMDLIEKKRQGGVSLTVLGVGTGNLNEQTLEQLANRGNGNYFYIDSFNEARRVLDTRLVSTVQTVAKDVKVQIEFNPRNVLEYRLIGYDNRILKKEDFNNDRVDAGEIGAGHTVTVLYELVLTGSELAKTQLQESRYQQTERFPEPLPEGKLLEELGFLKVRFKAPAGTTSQLRSFPITAASVRNDISEASTDFRFAASVSLFGHLLRSSKYAGSYGYDDIAELARQAQGQDPFGKRREFVELVENAASISRSPTRY